MVEENNKQLAIYLKENKISISEIESRAILSVMNNIKINQHTKERAINDAEINFNLDGEFLNSHITSIWSN